MNCRVKLFARARDLAGAGETTVSLPDGGTVADLRRSLAAACPKLTALLDRCAIAVNGEFASETQSLSADQELAILPPVSGG